MFELGDLFLSVFAEFLHVFEGATEASTARVVFIAILVSHLATRATPTRIMGSVDWLRTR